MSVLICLLFATGSAMSPQNVIQGERVYLTPQEQAVVASGGIPAQELQDKLCCQVLGGDLSDPTDLTQDWNPDWVGCDPDDDEDCPSPFAGEEE